ncbi:MAG TPA: VOC family protein [Bauldia sp.]|nr:VOC family protein [Bauldia sp.]
MTAARILGVLHPVVVTRDMEKALAFYRDLLGFHLRDEVTHDPEILARLGGPRHAVATATVLVAPDGSEIEIACFTRPAGRDRCDAEWPDAGIRSLTFKVDNIAGMVRRLAAAGYATAGEVLSLNWEGKAVSVAYVNGPDGVVLTLLEHGPRT